MKQLVEALEHLKNVGLVEHSALFHNGGNGEVAFCPAICAWDPKKCECGADEHNLQVNSAYLTVLKLMCEMAQKNQKPYLQHPKMHPTTKPLNCHGIHISDSHLMIGKSDSV